MEDNADADPQRGVTADGLRFLLAGAANTVLTLLIFQLLVFVLPFQIAYVLTWLCGLGIIVLFYPTKVFLGGRTDRPARARLGLMYVAVFLVGLASLEVLRIVGIMPRLAIIFVLVLTIGLNFLFARLLLRGGRGSTAGQASQAIPPRMRK